MKVKNKSGGQLKLNGKPGSAHLVLAKDAEHIFKDEKELLLYKAEIQGWGAALELDLSPAAPAKAAPAKAEKKEEKPADPPKKEEKKEVVPAAKAEEKKPELKAAEDKK